MKMSNKNRRAGNIALEMMAFVAIVFVVTIGLAFIIEHTTRTPATLEIMNRDNEVIKTIQVDDYTYSDSGISYLVNGERHRYNGMYHVIRK